MRNFRHNAAPKLIAIQHGGVLRSMQETALSDCYSVARLHTLWPDRYHAVEVLIGDIFLASLISFPLLPPASPPCHHLFSSYSYKPRCLHVAVNSSMIDALCFAMHCQTKSNSGTVVDMNKVCCCSAYDPLAEHGLELDRTRSP